MIKANELKIGNYVHDNLKNCVIKMQSANGIVNVESKPHEYNPIELTKEWLLKAGFIRKNGYGRIHSKLNGNIFISECGSYYVYKYYDIRIELKYVHQLQNLWFSLCGEELVFSTEP